jgi:putative transposase
MLFPKRKPHRKKNIREGHEFHSCRFRLKQNRGFQPLRELLKPTRLISPTGTYFLTFRTWHYRRLFVVEIYARVFLKTLYHYRREGRYALHAFIAMPDHVHLMLTPAQDVTIERAVQLIKGAYSHELGALIGRNSEIWQRGFTDHRIRDAQDFIHHRNYVHQNPVVARLVLNASDYRYCSAFPGFKLDPWPSAAEAAFIKEVSIGTSGTRALPGSQ